MLKQYANFLELFAQEIARVLKPDGNAFVTFGTDRVAGVAIDCSEVFLAAAMRQPGLRHVGTLVDTIPSRGLLTSRHRSAATINDERVVWITSSDK